jgi:DnaJ-like protein
VSRTLQWHDRALEPIVPLPQNRANGPWWNGTHAREQGAFDNLQGAGKPLPNLDQVYDPLWWVKQLLQREQLSILPPSLELLRKVEKELAAIEKLADEATVRRRVAALNAEIAKLNATVMEGPPTRLSTLDVDKVVARWRPNRSANGRSSPPISRAPQADAKR